MIDFIAGFFRDDRPESMGRLCTFMLVITGIIIALWTAYKKPEEGAYLSLTLIGSGVVQKVGQKISEVRK